MPSRRHAALALLAFLLLFWSVAAPLLAQSPEGRLVVATDYEMFGVEPLTGGGHVTWTLSGERARELRAKIVHMFDEYTQIPRGFTYYQAATGRVPDGRIHASEGLAYTDLLENELEGIRRTTIGTQVGYFLLDRADLVDRGQANALNRSTSGLLGTDATSTSDLQVRFLFNGATTTSDSVFSLPTRAYADALHNVFSYSAQQSSDMLPSGGYPGSWPLLEENGWHVVTEDGRAALWAGDDATGEYTVDMDASMRTILDPVLAPSQPGFDLRFGSRAALTFAYKGEVMDAGDVLLLEIATAPTFNDWAPLSVGGQPTVAPSPAWQTVTVDLSAYRGSIVQLRFRFVSDAAGTSRGFFIRDFGISAPSFYEGEIVESTGHFLVGALSFAQPSVASGNLHLIRTPGGEILFYSAAWRTDAPPDDTIRFRTFDAVENPQALFGIMLVAAYVISRSQESAYHRYREAHPSVYRPAVQPARWLHILGKVAMGVLVLLYFIPTAFYAIGIRVFVSGAAYWFLALTLTLLLALGTRAYYRERLEQAPPPVAPEASAIPAAVPAPPPAIVAHCTHCLREISEGDKTYRCACGATYHLNCASSLLRCSDCRKPVAVEVVRKVRAISLRCESCGEVQTVPEGTEPRAIPCPACGGRLRHLDAGKRYLVIASNPAIAFGWMRDLAKGGKPALCVTPATPERLRLEFGVKDAQFLHVSMGAPEGVDPRKLDPAGLKAILPLAREGKGGVILYDGLDQIIGQASLGDVIRFLAKANDMAFVHGVTVIGRVAPGALTDDEVRRLRAEFDEVLDLSAQL